MSITAPPPSPSDADPDDIRSAWYAASRRRLGLTEAAWYDPAVEHVIQALTLDEPLDAAVTELGNARGSAGFDLRETASDLDALAEILPADTADRIHDEWQQLTVGDALWGDRRRRGGWVVERLEPNVALVLKTADRVPIQCFHQRPVAPNRSVFTRPGE